MLLEHKETTIKEQAAKIADFLEDRYACQSSRCHALCMSGDPRKEATHCFGAPEVVICPGSPGCTHVIKSWRGACRSELLEATRIADQKAAVDKAIIV